MHLFSSSRLAFPTLSINPSLCCSRLSLSHLAHKNQSTINSSIKLRHNEMGTQGEGYHEGKYSRIVLCWCIGCTMVCHGLRLWFEQANFELAVFLSLFRASSLLFSFFPIGVSSTNLPSILTTRSSFLHTSRSKESTAFLTASIVFKWTLSAVSW